MEPIVENQPGTDEVWKNSLRQSYAKELEMWHRASGYGRAKIMAREDLKGTGDLFGEALKGYSPQGSENTGGVARVLGMIRGT